MLTSPQARYVHSGVSIDHTPAQAVAAGDVVVLDDGLVTIAKLPIPAQTLGAVDTVGVFDGRKVNGPIDAGEPVYWDADGNPQGGTAGTGALTTDDTAGPFAGYAIAAALTADERVRFLLRSMTETDFVGTNAAHREQIVFIPIENLAADADIAARPVFAAPRAGVLLSAALLAQGSFTGVDNSNTMVVLLDDGTNTIVTRTYNASTVPTNNGVNDLGSLSETHQVLTANEIVRLSITNGTAADPPAMLLRLVFRPNPAT